METWIENDEFSFAQALTRVKVREIMSYFGRPQLRIMTRALARTEIVFGRFWKRNRLKRAIAAIPTDCFQCYFYLALASM